MQAARLKERLGYKLVLTCWETIPFLDAYRNVRTRRYRRIVLGATDLFLATTERAARCLELEGADPSRIAVSPPGVDLELIRSATPVRPEEHLVLSAGRLVWEKGHQDVLRAVAAMRGPRPRVLIIGRGPERGRLERYARELGIADRVEIRDEVPYAEMPAVYAQASAFVLASLPVWFWEEQYGMVLVEAICAGLPVLASTSGAVPEVAGEIPLGWFPAGDWLGLSRLLEERVMTRAPGDRAPVSELVLQDLSSTAAAERLGEQYARLLA
jgi:glycosyltransferase involved in cell wall biosynthesis